MREANTDRPQQKLRGLKRRKQDNRGKAGRTTGDGQSSRRSVSYRGSRMLFKRLDLALRAARLAHEPLLLPAPCSVPVGSICCCSWPCGSVWNAILWVSPSPFPIWQIPAHASYSGSVIACCHTHFPPLRSHLPWAFLLFSARLASRCHSGSVFYRLPHLRMPGPRDTRHSMFAKQINDSHGTWYPSLPTALMEPRRLTRNQDSEK